MVWSHVRAMSKTASPSSGLASITFDEISLQHIRLLNVSSYVTTPSKQIHYVSHQIVGVDYYFALKEDVGMSVNWTGNLELDNPHLIYIQAYVDDTNFTNTLTATIIYQQWV